MKINFQHFCRIFVKLNKNIFLEGEALTLSHAVGYFYKSSCMEKFCESFFIEHLVAIGSIVIVSAIFFLFLHFFISSVPN